MDAAAVIRRSAVATGRFNLVELVAIPLRWDKRAGRLGTPEDLAVVICTLASPMSGFVTGANYRVDGGQVRSVN